MCENETRIDEDKDKVNYELKSKNKMKGGTSAKGYL